MSKIDIREGEDSLIDTIQFAEFVDSDMDERYDVASDLRYDVDCHKDFIFIHCDDEDYTTIRRCDVPNLIRALEKSIEIWKD